MKNPYKTLGLNRKATMAEIKAEYRRRVMTAHPDVGGSPEEFAPLAEAYEVLSDPAKRAYYDEHGHTQKADNAFYKGLQSLFMTVLEEAGAKAEYTDLIERMQHVITENKSKARGTLRELKAQLDGQKKAVSLLSKDAKAPDIFRDALNAKILATEGSINQNKDLIKMLSRGAKFLEQYKYNAKDDPDPFDESMTRAGAHFRFSSKD